MNNDTIAGLNGKLGTLIQYITISRALLHLGEIFLTPFYIYYMKTCRKFDKQSWKEISNAFPFDILNNKVSLEV